MTRDKLMLSGQETRTDEQIRRLEVDVNGMDFEHGN